MRVSVLVVLAVDPLTISPTSQLGVNAILSPGNESVEIFNEWPYPMELWPLVIVNFKTGRDSYLALRWMNRRPGI